jgi:hypothetical protein
MIQTASVQRACLIAAFIAVPGYALADHVSLHALVAGDLALTDNEFAVPSNDDPEPDVYLDIRPGVVLSSEGSRFIEQLIAQAELIEYARHADSPTYNAYGTWKGIVLPGPNTDMAFEVDGSTGEVNSLSARSSPDTTTVQVAPSGATAIRSASAFENLGYQATRETRVTQTAFAQWTATDDNAPMPTTTNSFSTGVSVGAQRLFRHDTVGLSVGVTYLRLEEIAPPVTTPNNLGLGSHLQNQVNPQADVTWIHDWSRNWSTSLLLGIVYVNQIGVDPYQPTLPVAGATGYPIASATIAYTDVWGHASLRGGRAVTPDLFIAENTLTDSVTAQAAIPLYWLDPHPSAHDPKLALLGSVGYLRTDLIDSSDSSQTLGSFDVGLVDLGLTWQQSPGHVFGVRYELMIQHADAGGTLAEASFYRDTLYFTFNLRYPDDVEPKMPRTGQSYRSDRSDVAPAGSEPVVPDPVDPAPAESP